MKKRTIIIGVVTTIVVAISFGIFTFVRSFQEDQKEAEKNMEIINDNYDKFNQYIKQFNTKSELLQKEMNEEVYYTTLVKKNPTIVKLLEELDNVVSNILEIDKILKDKCKVYYKDVEVNQKCQSYNISTESVMTVFQEAVSNYNKMITNYNTWTQKPENKNYKKISLYQSKNINS